MVWSGLTSLLLSGTPMLASSKGQPTWNLPHGAVQVSDDLYYLGAKKTPGGKTLEGYAFIHRAANISASAKKGGPTSCYSYIGRGAKWKTPENWVINPANSSNLNGAAISAWVADGIAIWEDATDGTVGSGAGVNIMNSGSTTTDDLSVDAGTSNDVNEIYFADISGSSLTIGVTTVWGYFGGPASTREIIEWDQVYDDVDYDWSLSGESGKMDFPNVAVHEIGHAVGMGHSGSTCTPETMYAYTTEGETSKRDLHTGDINGINLLY